MTNTQITGIRENPLYRLMLKCFIITSLREMLFLSLRWQQHKFLKIYWFCFLKMGISVLSWGGICLENCIGYLFDFGFCNSCFHLIIRTIKGCGGVVDLDAIWFTMININIFLTWNQWIMISVCLSGFGYSQYINFRLTWHASHHTWYL